MTAYTGDTDVTRFSTYRPRGNTPNTNEATSVTTTDIAETTSSISQSTSSESSLSSSTGPILPPPTCTGDCPGNEAPDDDDNDNGNGEGSNNDDDGNNNNDGDSGDDDGDDSDSPGKGTIIGGSFGGILGLVILAVIGFFLRRWKKKRDAAVDGILDDTEERGLPGSGAAAGVGGAREIKPMANATTNEIPALYNKDMPHPTYRSPMDFPYASVAHNLDSAAVSRVASATVQPLAPVKDASIPSAGQQQQQHAVASRDLPPAAAAPERTASFNKCHAGDACNNTFWPIHMR